MWRIDIFNPRKLRLALGMALSLLSLGISATESAEKLLANYCLPCHANGDVELYPRLAAVATRLNADQLAAVVLNGKFDRAGEVQGQTVPVMPAHVRLANESIADIVNHLKGYQAGHPSRLSVESVARLRGMEAQSAVPSLSPADHARAGKIYHNQCAGCHAVDRTGRAGSALYAWAMQQRGTAGLMATLHLGSSWGMPAWGDERLSEDDLELLARYLQEPVGPLPRFDWADLQASWRKVDSKPAVSGKLPKELFVTLLHDTGQIGLIDAASRQVLQIIDTGIAPHDIALTDDGCRLAVLSRSADVALVDLCRATPAVVARAKVGYEGRTLAAVDGRSGPLLIGAYWPPQLAMLDSRTLQPDKLILLDEAAYTANKTTAEIAQVIALDRRRVLALTKENGQFVLIERGKIKQRVAAPAFLRAGSLTASQRYLVVPTDDAKLVVFDLETLSIRRTFFVPGLAGGGRGVSYTLQDDGGDEGDGDEAYWVTSAMGPQAPLVRVRTDGNPQDWWVEVLTEAGDGSLNVATHSAAAHIWVDHPLSDLRERSQSITLVDKADFATEVTLPIVEWAGLGGKASADGYARALHPQFSADGSEVWVTVWNRQDYASAVVIVDAQTLKLLEVIKDPRLTTAIRTYALTRN